MVCVLPAFDGAARIKLTLSPDPPESLYPRDTIPLNVDKAAGIANFKNGLKDAFSVAATNSPTSPGGRVNNLCSSLVSCGNASRTDLLPLLMPAIASLAF